jgi:hypothetical protein
MREREVSARFVAADFVSNRAGLPPDRDAGQDRTLTVMPVEMNSNREAED